MGKSTFVYLIIAVLVIFGGAILYRNNQNQKIEDSFTREDVIEDIINRPTQTINSKYQYKDGVHNFVGNISVPTPCHLVDVEIIEQENETEIAITTTASDDVCVQIVSEKEFTTSFAGPQDRLIVASLNGEVVNLNLFEVPTDQEINSSTIDIKG